MSRRIVLWVGLGALAIVCIAIALLVRANSAVEPTPPPTTTPASPTSTFTQSTLFLAVRQDSGLIADAVTLGVTPKDTQQVGSWLSMQPGLAVDVNEEEQVTVADRGPAAPQDTGIIVGNQLGIGIQSTLILDRLALAALVDAGNGVTVNVKNPIIAVNAEGKTVVLVRRGNRKLFGPAAADYVLTLNPGETQADRMARFDDVLRQVIVKLPSSQDQTRNILASLGSSSRSSGNIDQTAATLLGMRESLLDKTVTSAVVPATRARVDTRTIYTLEPAPNKKLMSEMFTPSVLVPGVAGALPRVRVYAAGTSYADVFSAQVELLEIDQTLVWGGVVPPTKKSQVFISNEEQRALGIATATALGLAPTTVKVDAAQTVGVQVTVNLGLDSTLVSPSASPSSSASNM